MSSATKDSDYYEREAERWASLRESGSGSSLSTEAAASIPIGALVLQKAAAFAMGGIMGAMVGGSVGVVGTLVQTGRLVGAGRAGAQAAAFMGTIFAVGGAFQG